MTTERTHHANDPAFNYYGRWEIGRTPAVTINSGALLEFAYTGERCTLAFDVVGFTYFPTIFVQVDNGPIIRTALSPTVTAVPVTPPFAGVAAGSPPYAALCSRHHCVRCWIATHSLYLTDAAGTQWSTLNGGCKFLGVSLEKDALLPLPYMTRQLEFLGDSITQGLRLLYTGTDDDTGRQLPYANWPQLTADLLGVRPVVTGFGGQGLTTAGTCGAPCVNTAFPLLYDGIRYTPPVAPHALVIYHGTNDGVSPCEFEEHYTTLLGTVTRTYPATRIVAVCPHNKTDYASAIRHAVAAQQNRNIHFLDYSAGVIAVEDTCDGCHLNPGGAVRLAVQLANDLQTQDAL